MDRHQIVRQLLRRILYSCLASCIVWLAYLLPLPQSELGRRMNSVVLRALDFPVAVATQVRPCAESAVDVWFRVHCPEPIGDLRAWFFNHLLVSVPTYTLLFYLLAWLARFVNHPKTGSQATVPADPRTSSHD